MSLTESEVSHDLRSLKIKVGCICICVSLLPSCLGNIMLKVIKELSKSSHQKTLLESTTETGSILKLFSKLSFTVCTQSEK